MMQIEHDKIVAYHDHSLGKFHKAIEFYQRARGIAEETRNNDLEGKAYGNLGSAHGSLGQFQKEIEFFQRALC